MTFTAAARWYGGLGRSGRKPAQSQTWTPTEADAIGAGMRGPGARRHRSADQRNRAHLSATGDQLAALKALKTDWARQ